MVWQAIKNWLRKLFAWWPWKQPTEIEHRHAVSPFHTGTTQGAISRFTSDGVASQSQPGIAQRLSMMEEQPERVVQPLPPPQLPSSASEVPETPLPLLPSPLDTTRGSVDAINRVPTEEAADIFSSDVPSTPTAGSVDAINRVPTEEQQLAFLHYLVKRGIVNEGFEEGKIPEQYRRE